MFHLKLFRRASQIKANDPQQVLTNKSMEETATVSHAGT